MAAGSVGAFAALSEVSAGSMAAVFSVGSFDVPSETGSNPRANGSLNANVV
jgi:hypothetical protein